MASESSVIVEPAPPVAREYGSRNDLTIKASFPDSPIYRVDSVSLGLGFPSFSLTDEEIKSAYIELLNGKIIGGFGMGSAQNLNYSQNNPPDMLAVVPHDRGGPAMATTVDNLSWPTPNIMSSPGFPNASGGKDMGAAPQFQVQLSSRDQSSISYGSGTPSPSNPIRTSINISKQDFTDLIKGRSY
tara:strand:+ start:126 stop:683 length:558 start_codon:yes stop_codon:yes gene_type:complete